MKHREFQTLQDYDEAIREKQVRQAKGHATSGPLAQEREQVLLALARGDLRTDRRSLENRREQLELSLRQIDAGFSRDDGYYQDVAHLFPYPGLVRLGEDIERLRRERAELAADLAFDPRITRSYRVVPLKPGSPRAAINVYWYFGATLRKLQPGDVIQLNARAAAEYADFLEPVEESDADASASPDTPASSTSEEASAAS